MSRSVESSSRDRAPASTPGPSNLNEDEVAMITAMPRIAIAVHDFGAAVATFRDTFGMPVVDFSPRTVATLGAHVGMCAPPGGSNIELMAPADAPKPLSQ